MEQQISLNEKIIVYLTLISGLSISAVAIYYSVIGLTAIFAAAVIPIMIMGITLEISKIIATLWLKQNWNNCPRLIKTYLIISILMLMCITSMGIFGFLSKSHNDQLLVTGQNLIQITEIERQISLEKRSIDDAIKVISQLDQAVQSLIDADRIRGPSGSIAVRKNQSVERDALNLIINESTKKINSLENQKIPLLEQKLNIESKVGPIKYIAKFIYGSEPDKDILEKSVTWVIIVLIIVFDPLAVILLIASQYSFENFRNRKEQLQKNIKIDPFIENFDVEKNISTSTTELNNNIDIFNLKKYPYLFNKPKSYHPPGIAPIGPMVANFNSDNEIQIDNVETMNSATTYLNEIQIDNVETTNSATTYLNNIKEKAAKEREEKIKFLVSQVKEGRLSLDQVPTDLMYDVKVRV